MISKSLRRTLGSLAGLLMCTMLSSAAELPDSVSSASGNSLLRKDMGFHPWVAAAEVTGSNLFVWSRDFFSNKPYAKINWKAIKDNFTKGIVWDNDGLATNHFGHAYHGGLYHNAARVNGLNFWQSLPYDLVGSAMWEFFAEIEPPAINDLLVTTLGGALMGEITFRSSNLILNDSSTGGERIAREAAAFIINPIGAVNRFLNGDMWKVRNTGYLYHDYELIPVKVSVSAGGRMLIEDKNFKDYQFDPYLHVGLSYGEATEAEQNAPFDFFTADFTVTPSNNQKFINSIQMLGRLWGKDIDTGDDRNEAVFGIFQHYNYYNACAVRGGNHQVTNSFCESVSYGPGLYYKWNRDGFVKSITQSVFANAIIMGGVYSDYFRHIDRDYNMGSGFSLKARTEAEFGWGLNASVEAKYYRIYTWYGVERKDLTDVEPLFYNTLGNEGNTQLAVVEARLEKSLTKSLGIELLGAMYHRNAHYRFQENVSATSFELKAGMVVHF